MAFIVLLTEDAAKDLNDLYTYIYWQTWQALSPAGQQALLAMTLAGPRGSRFTHLVAVSELEPDILNQALTELVAFSLLEVGGDLEERRYSIHRLTETFLLTEIANISPKEI